MGESLGSNFQMRGAVPTFSRQAKRPDPVEGSHEHHWWLHPGSHPGQSSGVTSGVALGGAGGHPVSNVGDARNGIFNLVVMISSISSGPTLS